MENKGIFHTKDFTLIPWHGYKQDRLENKWQLIWLVLTVYLNLNMIQCCQPGHILGTVYNWQKKSASRLFYKRKNLTISLNISW